MPSKKLYLNPAPGHRVSGVPVAYTDFQGLRSYAHGIRNLEDAEFHSMIDTMDIKHLRQWFIDQGFNFVPLDETNYSQDAKELVDG